MSESYFTKSDWVLFRSKIPEWQENHMGKLNREYIALLTEAGRLPSEKFWKLEKRIREDRKRPGVQLEMTTSDFIPNIIALINDGVIEWKDLEDFSEELRSAVSHFCSK